jgi:hypothetical protein
VKVARDVSGLSPVRLDRFAQREADLRRDDIAEGLPLHTLHSGGGEGASSAARRHCCLS